MKRKAKPETQRSTAHLTRANRRVVLTPIRLAVTALIEGRLNRDWHWVCPSMSEVMGRVAGGRATKFAMRRWLNGSRRAPQWFLAVLDGELRRQIEHRQHIRELLAAMAAESGDRRRGALARARMREHWRAGDPRFHTGKRMGEAPGDDSASKNDPHN